MQLKKPLMAGIIGVVCATGMALPAFAHEEREVGDYVIAFGWRVEPALSGQLNGPDLYISLPEPSADQETILAELAVDVQVEVSYGGETTTVALEPDFPFYEEFDGVGYVNYVANLLPTVPGDYTFQVTGTIGEQATDETFTSADGMFSTIEPAEDVMFPLGGMIDVAALLERIEALEARIAELEALQGA